MTARVTAHQMTDEPAVEIRIDNKPVALLIVPSLGEPAGYDGYWQIAGDANDPLQQPVGEDELLIGSWDEAGEFVRLHRVDLRNMGQAPERPAHTVEVS